MVKTGGCGCQILANRCIRGEVNALSFCRVNRPAILALHVGAHLNLGESKGEACRAVVLRVRCVRLDAYHVDTTFERMAIAAMMFWRSQCTS